MKVIENQNMDEERALYGSVGLVLRHCNFDGPADGESACKECSQVVAQDCCFNLRYPFWHNHGLELHGCEMTENCRAALWYSDHITVRDTVMHGIKALRECREIDLCGCDIVSPEFGWSTAGIRMRDCTAESEYFLMRAEDIRLSDVELGGKYSFQYTKNAVLENCRLDTKDAFWHSENVTVRDSVIRGEYLAWYSRGLTLIHCQITGTQPFCYCRDLKLIDCEMLETDLCFEKSEVEATVTTPVISIKNPRSGRIVVPAVGEIIMDDEKARGEIVCP